MKIGCCRLAILQRPVVGRVAVTPKQGLHLTGAAILVSRDTTLLCSGPGQVSLVVSAARYEAEYDRYNV
jgi:hypothetical protein